MKRKIINSQCFDDKFRLILEKKKGKNVIKGRFDIESIELNKKIGFIARLLSTSPIDGLTYKILFWEKSVLIENFIGSIKGEKYIANKSYENDDQPGEIFVDDNKIDYTFIKALLSNHFNYEHAKNPSLNIRVQICINHNENITLLDIYDDRGFDIYIL